MCIRDSLYVVVHGIFYIGGSNLKTENLRSELRKVHPILRLSASTLIHLDKELMITDAKRVPEDYKKMGSSPKPTPSTTAKLVFRFLNYWYSIYQLSTSTSFQQNPFPLFLSHLGK